MTKTMTTINHKIRRIRSHELINIIRAKCQCSHEIDVYEILSHLRWQKELFFQEDFYDELPVSLYSSEAGPDYNVYMGLTDDKWPFVILPGQGFGTRVLVVNDKEAVSSVVLTLASKVQESAVEKEERKFDNTDLPPMAEEKKPWWEKEKNSHSVSGECEYSYSIEPKTADIRKMLETFDKSAAGEWLKKVTHTHDETTLPVEDEKDAYELQRTIYKFYEDSLESDECDVYPELKGVKTAVKAVVPYSWWYCKYMNQYRILTVDWGVDCENSVPASAVVGLYGSDEKHVMIEGLSKFFRDMSCEEKERTLAPRIAAQEQIMVAVEMSDFVELWFPAGTKLKDYYA